MEVVVEEEWGDGVAHVLLPVFLFLRGRRVRHTGRGGGAVAVEFQVCELRVEPLNRKQLNSSGSRPAGDSWLDFMLEACLGNSWGRCLHGTLRCTHQSQQSESCAKIQLSGQKN